MTLRVRKHSAGGRRAAVEALYGFRNLFAAYQGQNYRIDRHPVMARYPVTPMTEADLCLHLGEQTDKAIGLVDIAMLEADDVERQVTPNHISTRFPRPSRSQARGTFNSPGHFTAQLRRIVK